MAGETLIGDKLADVLGYNERYIGPLKRCTKSLTLRTIRRGFSTKPSINLWAGSAGNSTVQNVYGGQCFVTKANIDAMQRAGSSADTQIGYFPRGHSPLKYRLGPPIHGTDQKESQLSFLDGGIVT